MAKKNSDTIREVLRNSFPNPQGMFETTTTTRIWSKHHDDGSVEETTQTTRVHNQALEDWCKVRSYCRCSCRRSNR